MAHKILIVEDSQDLSQLLRLHLRDCGYRIDIAAEGNAGLAMAQRGGYDLIVLDIMLPGIDGLEICRRLRAEHLYTPILMLTSKSSEIDRVVGLEMGADDYLTKPFSIPEFLARVKAIIRRVEILKPDSVTAVPQAISVGDLTVDLNKRSVMLDGRSADLTAKEFDLLAHFVRHPGRVYTRSQLLDQVWGYGHDGYEHTVNSHINRLRAKIERNPEKPEYVLTVWGVGYKFVEDRV